MILNKGDIGHHMYFICMGEVEVLSHKDETPLATLKEGDIFGEVCLVNLISKCQEIHRLLDLTF